MRRIVFLLFLPLSLLFACQNNQSVQGVKEIVILHTNDIHGQIDNFAKLAALKNDLQKEYDDVLLVSAGDLFSGNPFVDYYKDKGYPIIDLMNKSGYDLSEIGNHEFDYGQEILKKRIDQAEFPFICANMFVENNILEQPESDYTFTIDGIKIFFAGLLETSNEGLPSTHPNKVKGISFKHAFEVLNDLEKKSEDNNVNIALSHLGVESDITLTTKTQLFDIIIGGHSHSLLKNAIDTNNVMIVQAGDELNQVGKLILKFDAGNLINTTYEIVDLNSFPDENPEIAEIIKSYYQTPGLGDTIATALSDIKGNNELGALFTDAQIEMSDLDFCFQNTGGIRISKIEKGGITQATVYSLDPFGNSLIKMELKPKEIENLIKSSFDRSPKINLLIGGGTYTIKTDENNNWISLELLDNKGKELYADSTYTVGLNSYISTSYTFEHEDKGTDLNVTTAENMINFLKNVKTIDYSGIVRQEITKEQ